MGEERRAVDVVVAGEPRPFPRSRTRAPSCPSTCSLDNRRPTADARIGHATAEQVRATGISWAFAPTLAVVQNPRWGRAYESQLGSGARPLVRRGDGSRVYRDSSARRHLSSQPRSTISATAGPSGEDQGETRATESNLAQTHAAGYYGALKANVQTVMVSYSSFTDTSTGKRWGKMHGDRHLVTDVLKRRLDFDGLVVSDWNAIGQLPGCTNWHCPQAINAGVDLIMVPDDWKKFIGETVADVRAGRIPMSRIDDAVSRIIRVKMKAGLFKASPATGPHPDASVLTRRKFERSRARRSVNRSCS